MLAVWTHKPPSPTKPHTTPHRWRSYNKTKLVRSIPPAIIGKPSSNHKKKSVIKPSQIVRCCGAVPRRKRRARVSMEQLTSYVSSSDFSHVFEDAIEAAGASSDTALLTRRLFKSSASDASSLGDGMCAIAGWFAFVATQLNAQSIDLQPFPASNVCQWVSICHLGNAW